MKMILYSRVSIMRLSMSPTILFLCHEISRKPVYLFQIIEKAVRLLYTLSSSRPFSSRHSSVVSYWIQHSQTRWKLSKRNILQLLGSKTISFWWQIILWENIFHRSLILNSMETCRYFRLAGIICFFSTVLEEKRCDSDKTGWWNPIH